MTREEIVKELERAKAAYNYNAFAALTEAIEILTQKPEQKKGKWIECENPTYSSFDNSEPYTYRCTGCLMKNDKLTKFCPNCGAKMEVEE